MSRSKLADAARQAWAEVAALATEPRDAIGEASRAADVAAATAEADRTEYRAQRRRCDGWRP